MAISDSLGGRRPLRGAFDTDRRRRRSYWIWLEHWSGLDIDRRRGDLHRCVVSSCFGIPILTDPSIDHEDRRGSSSQRRGDFVPGRVRITKKVLLSVRFSYGSG